MRCYQVSGTAIPQLTQQFDYDAQGNQSKVWDGNNNLTQRVYDDKGRVKTIINAKLEETYLTYVNDHLTQVEVGRTTTDGPGQFTRYNYNSDNQLTAIDRQNDSNAWLPQVSFTTDSLGNRLSQTDADNRTTTYTYSYVGGKDNKARLKTESLGGNTVTYNYDAAGNRISVTDANNQTTLSTYDDLNRLIQTEQQGISPSAITQYQYDANNNLTKITDPEARVTQYDYDALSQRTAVIQPMLQAVQTFYDNRGRIDYVLNARNQRIDYDYTPWGPVNTVNYYPTACRHHPRQNGHLYL